MMSVRKASNLFCALIVLTPMAASAQVVLSEIMYDVPGADTGHEWIEVFNSGSSAIDLSAWKLFEANSSHTITAVSGGNSLAPGAYAVIADQAPTFLTDHPSFSGQLFHSAFSLSNSGETLALRDGSGADKDTLTYTAASGAGGDGNSLHRTSIDSTTLTPGAPSPGTGSFTISLGTQTAAHDAPVDVKSAPQPVQAGGSGVIEPQIIADAGKDRIVVVAADALFEGKAFTISGEPLEPTGIRFLWNFGDGKIAEGYKTRHAWMHPGRYVVTLDVSASKNSATHRIIVTAKPAALTLSILDDGSAVVDNKGDSELDLSLWHVKSGEYLFTIPEDTVVLVKERVIIPPQSLGFTARTDAALLYPNGEVAGAVSPPKPFIAHVAVKEQHSDITTTKNIPPKIASATALVSVRAPMQQTAAAAAVTDDLSAQPSKFFNTWTLALFGLMLCGAVGAYAASRRNKKEWEIVEEQA